MAQVTTKTTASKTRKVRAPHRTNADLMAEISAKFGSATSIISVTFQDSQEQTVLHDLASLTCPRFNKYRNKGLSDAKATERAQALITGYGSDYQLPEQSFIQDVLKKGEVGMSIDFGIYTFDTGRGICRGVVIGGRLEFLTLQEVGTRLERVMSAKKRAANIATSSTINTQQLDALASEFNLQNKTPEEIVNFLQLHGEVLTNAFNSMAGLEIDKNKMNEAQLLATFLDWLGPEGDAGNGVFVALDFHNVIQHNDRFVSEIQRRIKNLAHYLPRVHRRLILAGSRMDLTSAVGEGLVPHLELKLPQQEELAFRIDRKLESIKVSVRERKVIDTLSPEERTLLHRAAQGLPVEEVETVLLENTIGCAVGTENPVVIDSRLIEAMNAAKIAKLKKYKVELAPAPDVPAGGMPNLKVLLNRSKRRFWAVENQAEQPTGLKLKLPNGILITGITGCGKSLIAKTVAKEWGVPLIKLSIGGLYSKFVGETDERFRKVRELINACAPAVVLIDEIDKGLGAAASGHSGDSGTSDRLIGDFLTWMQDREANIFFIATANDISAIQQHKPELLRKERWDHIVFVDLPNAQEREEILATHLLDIHYGDESKVFTGDEMAQAVAATASFVGAELASAVGAAADFALDAGRQFISLDDFLQAAGEIKPIAVSTKTTVDRLRGWAAKNAVRANGDPDPETTGQATTPTRRSEVETPSADKAVML